MTRMADTTFGISPEVQAILAWFSSLDREDVLYGAVPGWEKMRDTADIRVTAFYRETRRGGFLVSARPGEVFQYLHLAVIEHGSTGEPVVIEWRAQWQRVSPTTEYPESATLWRFSSDRIGEVVDHLVARIVAYLSEFSDFAKKDGAVRE